MRRRRLSRSDDRAPRRRHASCCVRPRRCEPYPARLTDRLEHWAREAPDRVFVAKRERGGDWRTISYAQMLDRAQRIGQALAERGLSSERPIAILSDNDLEHLSARARRAVGGRAVRAGVAGVLAGVAGLRQAAPHPRQRHAGPGVRSGAGIRGGDRRDGAGRRRGGAERRHARRAQGHARSPSCSTRRPAPPPPRRTPGSGPTRSPSSSSPRARPSSRRASINTQRMRCANQQMIRQSFAFLADEPPVLVDWLPWNHTFGGNHNVGIALYNGGTLYIDDGKPTPQGHRRDAAQPARDLADDLLQRAEGLRGNRRGDGARCRAARAPVQARQGVHVRRRRAVAGGVGSARPSCARRRSASASRSSAAWA